MNSNGTMTSTDSNELEPQRNEKGQWVKGVSGNPQGLAKGHRHKITELKQSLEAAVRENLRATDVTDILTKMISMAKEGDTKAAKLVLDSTLSKAVAEDSGEVGDGQVVINVRNMTVKAQNDAEKEKDVTQNSTIIDTKEESNVNRSEEGKPSQDADV